MTKKKMGRRSMGPSVLVTYRLPAKVYDKLEKISASLFQPVPVILRAAAAEYVARHRPVRHVPTGITFKFPDDITAVQDAQFGDDDPDINAGIAEEEYVTDPDTESKD